MDSFHDRGFAFPAFPFSLSEPKRAAPDPSRSNLAARPRGPSAVPLDAWTPARAGDARALRRRVAPPFARGAFALAGRAGVSGARAPDRRPRPAAAGRGQA